MGVKRESRGAAGAHRLRRPHFEHTLLRAPSLADIPASIADALRGRYAFERELGRGGRATVYLAFDPKHRRSVAVKVLHPELATALGVERFLLEIQTAAGLTHPHILTVIDSGEVGGRLFYVMPYLKGGTLRDRLGRERQLPGCSYTQGAIPRSTCFRPTPV